MKGRLFSRSQASQAAFCAACGTALQDGRSSDQTWSLASLLPAGVGGGAGLCPECRRREAARRIGAVVSARL